ncbi:histidinol-phosphate transaminase [Paenibacillus sp. JX-17]|uniref:Histidinol-phosphate aminotransferase n=1 Tax=Paenibacillus lacisoli TaxID=3064525 RepID=A0ABT9C8Z1_9BACL|nr:histidinol-phosphate transaminase [Paenibacillus sp. JX-17]MDO7905063.1 histidinol-phosphate transaminase [Paenibacillus sp. JX-17]
MQPKSNIINLPVYQPGKPIEEVKRELGLSEVVKLASNENPYGSSPAVHRAIQSELENISIYPDGSAADLTADVARHVGVNRDQVIFGCGSDEIIALITRAFFLPGDETIMADQTFSVYKSNADIEGAVSIEVPLKDGTHDLEAMLAAITDRTKVIWICNPNNPTGTIVNEAELSSFVSRVPKHVMVVIDEAYVEYVTDPSFPDSVRLLQDNENVVILRTFSKIYGLASLRIGYGLASASVISLINKVREPFNTSRFGQAAARAAIADQDYVRDCREKNAKGIVFLQEEFRAMGLFSFPAHGNFIMVDVGRASREVFDELLQKGVIVRPGFSKYPEYIRVTVGSEEQNRVFLSALKQVLGAETAQV